MFELLPQDHDYLKHMENTLTDFCRSRPLYTYNHIPPTMEEWCEVYVSKKEKARFVFQPMADLTVLPVGTQKMIADMERHATKSGQTEDLIPWPSTLRRLGNFKVVPRKISNDEIPAYEPMEAPLPRRPEIPNIGDPFPKPLCYVHHFHEKGMPKFDVPLAEPEQFPPRKMDLSYFHPTPPIVSGHAMKHFPMVPFIDHPVWPPVEFVEEYDDAPPAGFDRQLREKRKTKRKKIVTRGIWELQMVSMRGQVRFAFVKDTQ